MRVTSGSRRLAVLGAAALCCAVSLSGFASAQAGKGSGLDLVLLLDRSPSVGSKSIGGERFVDAAASSLLEKVVGLAQFRGSDVRLAEANFGGRLGARRSLSPIQKGAIPALLPYEQIPFTNFGHALRFAERELAGATPTGRRRAVVVITDGEPWPDRDWRASLDPAEYFDDPKRPDPIRGVVQRIASSGGSVYLLTFRDRRSDAALWRGLVGARNYRSISSADAVGPETRKLTEDLLGDSETLSPVSTVQEASPLPISLPHGPTRSGAPASIRLGAATLAAILAALLLAFLAANPEWMWRRWRKPDDPLSQELELAKQAIAQEDPKTAQEKVATALQLFDREEEQRKIENAAKLEDIYEIAFAAYQNDPEGGRRFIIDQLGETSTDEKAKALARPLVNKWSREPSAFLEEAILVQAQPRGYLTLRAAQELAGDSDNSPARTLLLAVCRSLATFQALAE